MLRARLADYRDADAALAAQIEMLDAELRELDAGIADELERLEQTRSEHAALGDAIAAVDRGRRVERALFVALVAPAAAGLGGIVAMAILLLVLGLPFGDNGITAALLLYPVIGIYIGFRTGRSLWKASTE